MTTKCTGLMGRIFGHKYVAHVTYGAPTISMADVAEALMMPGDDLKAIKVSRPEFYHGCICQRCGAVNSNGDMKIEGNNFSNDNPYSNPVLIGAVKGEKK